MNDLEKELVFSQSVKAGKRIYYFDVKQSRNGDRYVSITESKKIVEGSYENPRISFEKHKLFLYKEDYEKFLNAFLNTLEIAKTGVIPAEIAQENQRSDYSSEASYGYAKPAAPSYAKPEASSYAKPAEPAYAAAEPAPAYAQPAAPAPVAAEEPKPVVEEPKPVVEEPVVTEKPVSEVKSEENSFKIDLDF